MVEKYTSAQVSVSRSQSAVNDLSWIDFVPGGKKQLTALFKSISFDIHCRNREVSKIHAKLRGRQAERYASIIHKFREKNTIIQMYNACSLELW